MAANEDIFPVTQGNVLAAYDHMYAPWVKAMGLHDFQVTPGRVSAILPQNADLQFTSGAICGQAIMAAVDTLAALAACTNPNLTRGTVYQHTHFVRPATGDDLRVEANVLRFGKTSTFIEARVTYLGSGQLVAHATLEFAV